MVGTGKEYVILDVLNKILDNESKIIMELLSIGAFLIGFFLFWIVKIFRDNWKLSKDKEEIRITKEANLKIRGNIAELVSRVVHLEQQIRSLRGLVNRKLGNNVVEETEKNISPDGLDDVRGLNENVGRNSSIGV